VPSTEQRHEVPIALLYAQQGLQPHLKEALAELGARVVYDAAAAQFDRSALDASGARVVLVNLEADADEEIDALDDLLADDALTVVFNDADVSNRLQGWDQARWARHLAAKIRGGGELNPPRPPGAEAVPVRVKPQAPERIGDESPDFRFQIEGGELDRALAADTGESLARTRAALVTQDEPVVPQLVDPHGREPARHDAPTVVLPRVELDEALREAAPPSRHDAPTLELRGDALRAAAGEAPAASAPVDAPREAASAPQPAVGGFDLPDVTPDETPALAATDTLADELEALSLDAMDEAEPAAPAADDGLSLDDEFMASLRDFGLADAAPAGASAAPADAEVDEPAGEATLDLTDEFGAALGALELAPLEEEATPSQREAPPAGLDDMLLDLPGAEAAAPAPAAKAAPAASAAAKTAAAPAAVAPKTKLPFSGTLSLADDDAAPPTAAPAPAPAVDAPKKRSLDEFDFSGLSLAPLPEEEEAARTPITGRAKFEIDEKDRAAAVLPPVPADDAPADDAGLSPDFELRGLREPGTDPDLAAELAAMAAAADALPLGQPVVHGVRQVWVLGASIGGPEAVREFLAAVPASTPVLFLLAQHMGADFLDLMVQQLARATTMPVRVVVDGDIARHGEVVVVPLAERLLVDADGTIRLEPAGDASPYSPSIDRVMRDVADRFGPASGAIVFSGMAHDAIDGAVYMRERGGTIWVQDPATCVISSMVDGAQEAGVVSFVGSPAELAQEFIAEMARRAAS
jgi:two-component system chemotaxis response regulator CheB/chemosensory pili system protein ChpB (putative protein-glutamate methylesterase)